MVFTVKIAKIIKKYPSFTPFSGLYNMSKSDVQKVRRYLRYIALSFLVAFIVAFIGAEIAAPKA